MSLTYANGSVSHSDVAWGYRLVSQMPAQWAPKAMNADAVVATPSEPAAAGLFATGLVGVVGEGRRKRNG